jgi:phosphoribosyl-ATP pyrophosphohydrolase/phosphoribosyl-AMP cyclohydrolase/histidinol dehydrogenase
MAPALLASIDLANHTKTSQGINTQALTYIGNVFARVTPETVDLALNHLQQSVGRYGNYLGVETLTSTDDIVSLLDAGAAKVFVTRAQLDQLKALNILDDRLVLALPGGTRQENIDAVAGTQVNVYSHVEDVELVEAWLKEYGTERPDVFVSFASPTMDVVSRISKLAAVPVIPAESLTVDPKSETGLLSVAQLLMAGATSDRPDGLFTTLVTDERGIALGLVYSSEESVAESLRTGRGVYQSRKRGLWYKGESSGDVQELLSVSLDCDNDCLRFVVRQKGRGGLSSFGVFELSDGKQASVIWQQRRALDTIPVCPVFSKPYRRERSLPQRDHTVRACSTTRSCYERRYWRKLPNCATRKPRKRLPSRPPMFFTLPSPNAYPLESHWKM